MGSAERRERERAELRDKILDAARDLFVAEGYDKVTMRRIAERIEYSPTAIYLHFADKAALLAELVAKDFAVFAAQFAKLAKVTDPLERLLKTGRAYVDFGLQHPNHYLLMFMLPRPAGADELAKHSGDPQTDAYAFLLGCVQACIASGKLRKDVTDAQAIAQILWMAMHGIVSLHIVQEGGGGPPLKRPKELVGVMLDALVNGLAR